MDSLDWNRLAVAALLSVSVMCASWAISHVMIQNTVPIGSFLFNSDGQEEKIDLSLATISKGKELAAQQCGLCHSFNKGEANKIGPNLYNIMGQNIASAKGFEYSESLQKHNKEIWDLKTLNQWLTSPTRFANSTIMAYPGLVSKQDRIDILAYLQSISPDFSSSNKKTSVTDTKK